jgi:hypothetical protein
VGLVEETRKGTVASNASIRGSEAVRKEIEMKRRGAKRSGERKTLRILNNEICQIPEQII